MESPMRAIVGIIVFFTILSSPLAAEEPVSASSVVTSSSVIGIARFAQRPNAGDRSCRITFSRLLKGEINPGTTIKARTDSPIAVSGNNDMLVFLNAVGEWTCVGECFSFGKRGEGKVYLLRVPTEMGPSSLSPAFLTLEQLEAMIHGKKLAFQFSGQLRFRRHSNRPERKTSPIILQITHHTEPLETVVKGFPPYQGFASKPTLCFFGSLFQSPIITISLTATDSRPLMVVGEIKAVQGSHYHVNFYLLAPISPDVNTFRTYLADATKGKPSYRLTFRSENKRKANQIHKLTIEMNNQSLHDLGVLHGWQPTSLPVERISYECRASLEEPETVTCSLTISIHLTSTDTLLFIFQAERLAERAVALGLLFPLEYDWVAACLILQDVKGHLILRSGETEIVVGAFVSRMESFSPRVGAKMIQAGSGNHEVREPKQRSRISELP